MLLHFLVVGDCIIVESKGDENDQGAEQHRCRRIVTIGAREPSLNLAPQASRRSAAMIKTQLEKANRTCRPRRLHHRSLRLTWLLSREKPIPCHAGTAGAKMLIDSGTRTEARVNGSRVAPPIPVPSEMRP